ncbi:MAG: hypothetical protein EBR82_06945 [Caulobacteraceae bacterium]|nr:hypothetical protein [Caulobacteraceae bacterium]
MIDWSPAPASSRLGALLTLLAKSVGLGAAMSGILTLFNAAFLLFSTRIGFPGLVFWTFLAWRLFISIGRLNREGRKPEAKGVMVLMAVLTPIAVFSALPLNDLLVWTSIRIALWINPHAPIGTFVQ